MIGPWEATKKMAGDHLHDGPPWPRVDRGGKLIWGMMRKQIFNWPIKLHKSCLDQFRLDESSPALVSVVSGL